MYHFDSKRYGKLLPSALGYEDLWKQFDELVATGDPQSKYPPHNVVRDGSDILLELALAGWSKSNLDVTLDGKKLTVTGTVKKDDRDYQHRGIGMRSFTRVFAVNDLEVESAEFENGVLSIRLKSTLPKPKKVDILSRDTRQLLTEGSEKEA